MCLPFFPFLQDLQDDVDTENSATKFHIISRLPKPFAEDCFRRWHHPITSQMTAKQQVAEVLQEVYLNKTTGTDLKERNDYMQGRFINYSCLHTLFFNTS